ncbi:sulfite exporter TauE/SafE family protein [Halorubrum sp. DTA98]|uniref:sulfite exporter TauE/SafE family protein n=1 Tax=Halorubrum sp. DTA98 TaxID=3402163 RepID=UPI003AAC232E
MIDSLLRVDLLLFLVIGLFGGAHCIGMCGPLVTVYAGEMAEERSDSRGHLTTYEVRQHALFNLGRTVSYAAIGAVFGAIGGVVFVGTDTLVAVADPIRGFVGIGVGAIIVALGVRYVLGNAAPGLPVSIAPASRLVAWLTQRVSRLASGPGIVALGGLHGLLPCPILYPAFLYAFAMGDPVVGAVALGALGLGTFPAVFAYGTVIGSVDAVHRRRVHRLLGVAFVALGYVLFAHGLMSFGVHLPHPELPHYQPLGGGHAGH